MNAAIGFFLLGGGIFILDVLLSALSDYLEGPASRKGEWGIGGYSDAMIIRTAIFRILGGAMLLVGLVLLVIKLVR